MPDLVSICCGGFGAVSPAGWDAAALLSAIRRGEPLPTSPWRPPGRDEPFRVRSVPSPERPPAILRHPRMRRASSISRFAVAAAAEAVAADVESIRTGQIRLGIVVGVLSGGVQYSHRFYDEVLEDPERASPLLFPETVFNAPASHIAACLGVTGPNYTLVGDDTAFVRGLAVASQWLVADQVDACVVVGAEEMSWLVASAARLFDARAIQAEGAGAVYLKRAAAGPSAVRLAGITDPVPYVRSVSRSRAAALVRDRLGGLDRREVLCLSARRDADVEHEVWRSWEGRILAPRVVLGNAFNAATAWQVIAAGEALRSEAALGANVSVLGINEQAQGLRIERCQSPG